MFPKIISLLFKLYLSTYNKILPTVYGRRVHLGRRDRDKAGH